MSSGRNGPTIADRMRQMRTLGLVLLAACAGTPNTPADNPFLSNQDDDGKADSAYINPDGTEVEVDIEGDVTGGGFQAADAPALLGQFALTDFRKSDTMYIESLAEDASAAGRAEWLIGGNWVAAK